MFVKLSLLLLAGLIDVNINVCPPPSSAIGSMRRPAYGITVHHTEGPLDTDQIRADHLTRGWSDCGYHFWISQKGHVEYLRPMSEVGANSGKNDLRNYANIGIALEDGKEHPVNELQFTKLIQLTADLCRQYDISPTSTTITRHHEQCPGQSFPIELLITEVKRLNDEKRPLTFAEFEADRKNRPGLYPKVTPTPIPTPTATTTPKTVGKKIGKRLKPPRHPS